MNKRKGFTLVEAAVAIAVVAILSGIIIPLILKSIRDARNARARNDIHVIVAAIAHQLKDTGSRRPMAPGGPNGASGAGNAIWYSAGDIPRLNAFLPAAVDGAAPVPVAANLPGQGAGAPPTVQRFENLFLAPSEINNNESDQANAMFGYGPWGDREFQYRGPYMTDQVAHTADPWGYAYVILGYNQNGMAANNGLGGPIWVVCAGESHRIDRVNVGLPAAGGAAPCTAPDTWNYQGVSATNIAVQVH
jgi:prepilin-type N-terminal cleavage/methylation domain-containing protein